MESFDRIDQAKARITELESKVLVLTEALEEMVDMMNGVIAGDYKPDSFTCLPAEQALTSTTPQATEITQRIRAEAFSEGVDECVSSIQQKIDGIDAIERGAFNGNLTDKAIYTRKAWKSARKALQSIKKEVL